MGKCYMSSQRCDSLLKTSCSHKQRTKLFILVITISFLFWFDARASLFVRALKNRHGSFTVISAKPCQNALGQLGICMFMWDCIKSEGVHLGTCSDRFLFGSCCHHNSTSIAESQQQAHSNITSIDSKNQYSNTSIRPIQTTSLASLATNSQSYISIITTTPAPQISALPTRPFLQSTSTLSHQVANSTSYWFNSVNQAKNNASTTSSSDIPIKNIVSQVDNNIKTNMNNNITNLVTHKETPNAASQSGTHRDNHETIKSAPANLTNSLTNFSSLPQYNVGVHSDTNTVAYSTQTPSLLDLGHSGVSNNTNLITSSIESESSNVASTIQQNAPSIELYETTRPTLQPTTTPISIYMNPLAPNNNNQQINNKIPQQQNKPQGISWLSKPSLIANAIFHSFKPYLNGNRHRPTYKPYITSSYRPQHYRPIVGQQQRPLSFGQQPNLIPTQQPFAMAPIDTTLDLVHPSDNKISSTMSPINDDQTSNNDHHIVNPSMSSMTTRHRPMDKNHYGIDGYLQQNQKQNQSESSMNTSQITSNNSSNEFSGTISSSYSTIYVDQTKAPTTSVSLLESNMQHQNISNNYNTFGDKFTRPYNNSIQIDNYNQTSIGATHSNMTSHFPSYPLISGFPDHVTHLQTAGPIDEIHGLSTVGSLSPVHHEKLTSTTQSPTLEFTASLPQTSSTVNSHTNGHSTESYHSYNFQSNSLNNDIFRPDSTTLPPGTILIGNIDEHQSSTGSTLSMGSEHSITQNTMTMTTANLPANVIREPLSTINQFSTTPLSTTTTTTTTTHAPSHIIGDTIRKGTGGSRDPNSGEVTCGVTSMYPQTKVVGGRNAAFGAWPWQVSVRKVSFFGFSSTHRCGGAVISSDWIATAGHCVEDLALQSIRIRVGEYDFSSMSEPYPHIERAAKRKVVHPKYNFYTYENDLALVQLDQPLQFPPHVSPICLPPDNIDLLGRNATVTGWGRLNEGGTLPTILQEVRVPIVSNDKCKDMFLNAGRPEYIPDIFLCAGYEEGGRDSCQGDSGGPLQVRGDDGKWFLAGIISWGIGCAEQNLPGVCTRISRFKLWIQSTMSSS